MPLAGQSSRTPYDHLRYRYPSTWKRLCEILDKSGAPVAATPNGVVRTPGGHRLEGAHDPLARAVPPRSPSDPVLQRWLSEAKQEAEKEQTLRRMKNNDRNPF